jgi:hypothetical protein
MALVTVERLGHLGLIAEVIKDLGLIGMIDARLVPDEQEVLTPGEAVAGMILNVRQSAPVFDTTVFCQQTPRPVVS